MRNFFSKERNILIAIFILALVLRVSFIILYDNHKMLQDRLYAADARSYDTIAVNLLHGKGFVYNGLYARRGPVYPLFLAFIYLIFGHSFVAARFAQAIIGALTSVIIYLLGKQLVNKKVGLMAGLISAIYYPFILQPAYLLTEVFFTFLLVLSITFFTYYHNDRKHINLFIGAILFGTAGLCKAVILPFTLFLIIWLITMLKFKFKDILLPIGILISGIIITVSPWTVRNYVKYKAFIPVTIESGRVLYLGNNPLATGGTGGWTKYGQDQFLPEGIGNPDTLKSDRMMLSLAIKYIIGHPKRTLSLGWKKFINMWRPYYADARLLNKVIMISLYIPIGVLAIAGIIKTIFGNLKKYLLLHLLIFYFIIAYMAAISAIRYRYPVIPFLMIFAAYALLYAKNYIFKKRKI